MIYRQLDVPETSGDLSGLGSVVISAADGLFATALTRCLVEAGANITAEGKASDLVILTEGLASGESAHVHWQALEALRAAYRSGVRRIVLLQDTGGRFSGGAHGGWRGGLTGLAKTAQSEWPEVLVQCFDIARQDLGEAKAAGYVLAALSRSEVELGLETPGRAVYPILGARLGASRTQKRSNPGTWLIAGGARGVTADCVQAIARKVGGTFIFLGRSQPIAWPDGLSEVENLPALRGALARERLAKTPGDIDRLARALIAWRDVEATLSSVKATGAEAHYCAVDLQDEDTLSAELARLRTEHGPITGLIHGAGILADKLILDKTRTELDRVFGPKVGGLKTILSNLDLDALCHIGLFSSAAARFGNPGQADYAMANEVLNRVAHHLATCLPKAQVKAFNWGPWDGGMVDDSLAAQFRARGISLIARADGAAIFADQILNGTPAEVELVIGDEWTPS